MKISVVVPVLNELSILANALIFLRNAINGAEVPGVAWEVVVSDAGSTDGSSEIAAQFCRQAGWSAVRLNASDPTVGRTLKGGILEATGDLIVLLPCDCRLNSRSLVELAHAAVAPEVTCGGFQKAYSPTTSVLSIYAWLQNRIRLEWMHHGVWTNALFFRRELANLLPNLGFLDDVAFCDRLRRHKGWRNLRGPVTVSSRRYYPAKIFKRMALNGIILGMYRMRLADPAMLKKWYQGMR